jgi:hypothetical protein
VALVTTRTAITEAMGFTLKSWPTRISPPVSLTDSSTLPSGYGRAGKAGVDAAFDIVEPFTVNLLTAESRAFVLGEGLTEPGRCEVGAVLVARAADDDGRWVGFQLLENGERPRRGGDADAWLIGRDLAHSELKIVPDLARVRILAELVEPRGVAGETAQLVGFLGGVDRSPRSV